jgi:hypothetical protein
MIVPNRNGAVASAVLVHLRVEPAHFDWRWRERPALARLAWEAVARDPLARLRRIQMESINFRPPGYHQSRHRSIGVADRIHARADGGPGCVGAAAGTSASPRPRTAWAPLRCGSAGLSRWNGLRFFGLLPLRRRKKPMCDKCIEIDKRTERYRRISASISDQLTIDRIDALVEKLEAEKAALHPRESAGPHS